MGTRGKQVSLTKVCSVCKIEKLLSSYYVCNKSKDSRQYRCKECSKTLTQAATKNWKINKPDAASKSNIRTKIKTKYGLTLEELTELLNLQGGCCEICKAPLSFEATSKLDKPHVDHDHITGIVRGILCLLCNTGLGMFGDSTELLNKAGDYIQRTRQSDRLSELAPHNEDDAIVGSYGKYNRKRSAEMTDPTLIGE